MIIIDATQGTLGRIAAYAAKQALLGKEIAIVNCSHVLITGNKEPALEKYRHLRKIGGWALKGPNFPRSPERIMKRTVRGMLSYKQERGASALKRVKCYNLVPEEMKEKEKISMKRRIKSRAHELSEVSRDL